MQATDPKTVATRYEELERYRQPFLDRARDVSTLTIPSLIPPLAANEATELPTPFQAMGARGVNNLASKLLLALLPPSSAFFRLTLSEKFRKELDPRVVAAADLALSKMEQAVLREIETRNIRASAFETFKHLIVGGNVLIYLPPDERTAFRFFPLEQYVVARDPAGNVLRIIIKEVVDIDRLPDAVNDIVKKHLETKDTNARETDVDIYTDIRWDNVAKRWEIHQEVLGEHVEDSDGHYPKDKLPWVALRWAVVANQDYGRSHGEEYFGDLASLDALEKDMLDGAAVCATGRWMVKPNSGIDVDELTQSKNWSFHEGSLDDIGALQANKFADMQVVSNEINRLEARLSYAFLLNSAVQRDAERVTAEEIRLVAQELEDTLGGVYSVMSTEFQLPLVTLLIAQMQKANKLPNLPKDALQPIVVTGLDALGRNRQSQALDELVQGALETFGPQALAYINMTEWFTRKAAAKGIDPTNLIKTDDEVNAERTAANQQEMIGKLGPSVIKGVSDNVAQAQQQQQSQENAG